MSSPLSDIRTGGNPVTPLAWFWAGLWVLGMLVVFVLIAGAAAGVSDWWNRRQR